VPRADCSLLDHPSVLRIVFYPRPDFRRTPDDRDVSFPAAEGVKVGGRIYIAGKDAPLILLFHGNGEIASDYDGIAPLYTGIEVSLVVADYRGYGKSDGTPTASALLDDAIATHQSMPGLLKVRGLDGSRLFLMGRSLGSAAALEIASRAGNAISGLIIESGFASALGLIESLSGTSLPQELKAGVSGFENVEKIRRVEVPTLIIHGEEDEIIPVENGKILYDNSAAQRKRLVLIPGAGHNDLLYFGQERYFNAIREFVFG
jgi:fermentation-respiration switch protein FrsA (DUF1100 family)